MRLVNLGTVSSVLLTLGPQFLTLGTDVQIAALRVHGLTEAQIDLALSSIAASKATGTLTASSSKLGLAFKGLGTFLKANPLVGVAAIAAGAYAAYKRIKQYQEEQRQAAETAANDYASTITNNEKSAQSYIDRITELKEKIESGTLSTQELYDAQSELLSIQAELTEHFGTQASDLHLLSQNAEEAAASIRDLYSAENESVADQFLSSEASQISKAFRKMDTVQEYSGRTNKYTIVDPDVMRRVHSIMDQYGVSVEQADMGGYFFRFNANARDAYETTQLLSAEIRSLEQELKAEGIDLNAMFFGNGSGTFDTRVFSAWLQKSGEIIDDWGDIYDRAVEATIRTNSSYSKFFADYENRAAAYQEVLKTTYNSPSERAAAMQEALDNIDALKIDFADLIFDDSYDDQAVRSYFQGLLFDLGEMVSEESEKLDLFGALGIDEELVDRIRSAYIELSQLTGKFTKSKLGLIRQAANEYEATGNLIDITEDQYLAYRHLNDIAEEYNLSVDELTDVLVDLGYLQVDSISATNGQAGAFGSLSGEIQAATEALEAYKKATETEHGDTASQYKTAYQKFLEDHEAGRTGSKAYSAAIDLFMPEELQRSLGYDVKKMGEVLSNGLYKAVFGGEGDVGENFANYMRDNIDKYGEFVDIIDNGDGTFDFAYHDLEGLAKACGLTVESMGAVMDAIEAYGTQAAASNAETRVLANSLGLVGSKADETTKLQTAIQGLANSGLDAKGISQALQNLDKGGYIDLSAMSMQELGDSIYAAMQAYQDYLDALASSEPEITVPDYEPPETPEYEPPEDPPPVKFTGDDVEFQAVAGRVVETINGLDGQGPEIVYNEDGSINVEATMQNMLGWINSLDGQGPRIVYNEDGSVNVERTMQSVLAWINSLDGQGPRIVYNEDGSINVEATMQSILGGINMLDGQGPRIVYNEDGSVNVEATMQNVLSWINSLDGQGPKIVYNEDGSVNVMATMSNVLGWINGLDGQGPKIVYNEDGSVNVEATMENLLSWINALDGQGPKVVYNEDGSVNVEETMSNILSWINGLDGQGPTIISSESGAAGVEDTLNGLLALVYDRYMTINVGINATATGVGTNHHGGKFASGTKNAPGGPTLVNELGPELISDNGVAYIAGGGEPTITYLHPGAIVLTAEETKRALTNSGSGKPIRAAAGGVLGVLGSLGKSIVSAVAQTPIVKAAKTVGNIVKQAYGSAGTFKVSEQEDKGSGGGGGGGGGSPSTKDDKKEKVDWIEIAIDRIERAIDKLDTVFESGYKKLGTRLSAAAQEIAKINEEIPIQQKAAERYLKEANSVGLSEDLAKLVRDGTIDINEYDSDTKKLIDDYKKWYEKSLECSEAVDKLHESLAELYEAQFEATQKDFENQLDLIAHRVTMYQSQIDLLSAQGIMESVNYYTNLENLTQERIELLKQELSGLQKKMMEAMNSGEIEEYSETWYSFNESIMEIEESLVDANLELQNFENQIRKIKWDNFDYLLDTISQVTQEADFLIELMKNSKMFDEAGKLTSEGLSTIGLHGEKYNVLMQKAEMYAEELASLDKEIAKDPYNKDLIKRREELLKLQQDSIKSAQSEKESIRSLVEEGIKTQLSALKDLIDEYKESLNSAKSLYDYQEKLADKAEKVAKLQKQLAAYTGDTSEETRATVQKLQVDLAKAQKDLDKTEYEQSISDQKKMLDNLYEEYEEVLNERLDDVDALMVEMIDTINFNSGEIRDTLQATAESVGYTLSQSTQDIWNGSLIALASNFSDANADFLEQFTSVRRVLDIIASNVNAIVNASGLSAPKAPAFKRGGLINFTGPAWVDGSTSSPESILSAGDTENLIGLRDVLRLMAQQKLGFGDGIFGSPTLSGITDVSSLLSGLSSFGGSLGTRVGDITINIPIEHVESYNELIETMKKDNQFEKFILSMTVDPLANKSSLAKNSYRWK